MDMKNKIWLYLLITIGISLMFFSISVKSIAQESSESVKDIDGNVYRTIKIGDQTWMSENLRTSTYNDGTPIVNITDQRDWKKLNIGAYCWYKNDSSTYEKQYGRLYNLFAVSNSKLCPTGWHVAYNQEWAYLITNLGGPIAAKKELNGNGFTGPPGGQRNEFGFEYVNLKSCWWCFAPKPVKIGWTRVINHYLHYRNLEMGIFREGCKNYYGLSVRCLKDK